MLSLVRLFGFLLTRRETDYIAWMSLALDGKHLDINVQPHLSRRIAWMSLALDGKHLDVYVQAHLSLRIAWMSLALDCKHLDVNVRLT